jgi:hypothetical protein
MGPAVSEWQDKFYRLLEKKKGQPVTFGQVLRELHRATGRYEAFVASKLVATSARRCRSSTRSF